MVAYLMRSPFASSPWVWLEAAVCLGPTAIRAPFAGLVFVHHVLAAIRSGVRFTLSDWLMAAYGFGVCAGIAAALILLLTRFSGSADPWALWITRLGLIAGSVAVLFIPDGKLPQQRLTELDLLFELFCSWLPWLCLLHFHYLGRGYLAHGKQTAPRRLGSG
jgi:hypothetical protein